MDFSAVFFVNKVVNDTGFVIIYQNPVLYPCSFKCCAFLKNGSRAIDLTPLTDIITNWLKFINWCVDGFILKALYLILG